MTIRLTAQLTDAASALTGSREQRAAGFIDLLWQALGDPTGKGISWIGFYLPDGEPANQLVLGPSRNTPACSPISLHGACGRCYTSAAPLVVHDVADLGDGYVACDPRDRAEVVVPAFDDNKRVWAVLDADSHTVGAFTNEDAAALVALMRAAKLTSA